MMGDATSLQGLTGFTQLQTQSVIDSPIGEWVMAGGKSRKRIRRIIACIIQYDFEESNWYSNTDIKYFCQQRDASGRNAMNISNQRISALMRPLVAKEYLEQRVVNRERQYRKVIQ